MSPAVRLDVLLASRGLARSRSAAADLIRGGQVRVDGVAVTKPGQMVADDADITVPDSAQWVSRSAGKLVAALDSFGLSVDGRALDAGASTGGFTQILLERGCSEVYAVDVGHDQLAPSVRTDPRVHNREGLHLRDLTLADVGDEPVDCAVADVSFISLTRVLAPILRVVRPSGWAIVLVKPQFEVGRSGLDRQGVVTDPALRASAVAAVVDNAASLGWAERNQLPSTVLGQAGNQEFLIHLAGPDT